MKTLKIWSMIAVLAIGLMNVSCDDDDTPTVVNDIQIALDYPDGVTAKGGITVVATGALGTKYEQVTDDIGIATFSLPMGTYEFAVSESRSVNGKLITYNGIGTQVIGAEWTSSTKVMLSMNESTANQLIMKEVYFSGVPKNDGSGRAYVYDAYITLYNNSSEPLDLQNLVFGSLISNSWSMSMEIKEGETSPYWFKEDWTPAAMGYFYFPNSTILEPYSEQVVVVYGAIDHTATYPESVDLTKADYYTMYDVDVFNHKYYYPAPSANIPASQYLEAEKYGLGTAWGTTTGCPNVFLFYPEGQTPSQYANDVTDLDYWLGNDKFPRKKVPAEWIADAVDTFGYRFPDKENVKRINPKVDAGHVDFVSGKGYTLYRNVDKEKTEAIEGNKDKLVYNYAGGTESIEEKYGSTDPSGIDAEASIANGATIIFKDTNNSGNDFHLRAKSALKK